ncbi:glucan endo-1,3-beta-D-glucosidase ARB_01444-like [Rhododendron vialii]|uniref:glucan endo-1,3-beta-D-glucosidase ARB_01444-like n=1 Tax=Rhododendron vialii TaxID=182163 RepID=UPI00265F22DF|nr:glucan endo-1,3-beta-D-glucosidase ARB_01444-like [Rhododendron vialii]
MSPPTETQTRPFRFPQTESTVLPDPARFFSPNLLASPLPTNSFFQNFVLEKGDKPEYIHPYLIKSSLSCISLSYPIQLSSPAFTYQVFTPDLTISSANNTNPSSTHVVSSFSDLGLTLDLPSSGLRFFLVRGSPYLTCVASINVPIIISSVHAILHFDPNSSYTKYTITLDNNQKWVMYIDTPSSALSNDISSITSGHGGSTWTIRIAILPDSDPKSEAILDQFSSCYPVSGEAVFVMPFCLEYKWYKKGLGDLLMLAHPLHLRLLAGNSRGITVLDDFKYKGIDGEVVGVVGDSWLLTSDPFSVTWHSIGGVKEESYPEIIDALVKDVRALNAASISTNESYFYGKLVARAARLGLIAEELSYVDVIPSIRKYLKNTIEPWLDGTFGPNGFLYDAKWGGIVTKLGSTDSMADFGFGLYNDHHYHLGNFLYGIAVLAKIDSAWGRKYRPQAYSLMADFMNLGRRGNSLYPRLRCFDLWKLHSWAAGLTEFPDGRNQESTSQAVNAYYSAALMGFAYGDIQLVAIGSTLSAMEIHSAQMWCHVRERDTLYPQDFTRENRLVGILWANKRETRLWFAPSEWKECRLGIHLLPLLPISEVLFSEISFARELVAWTLPALAREGVGEGWKGFLYALQGVYDKEGSLGNIRNLNGFDDGNSRTNLLWWIHSRGGDEEERGVRGEKFCWFGHYCH